MSPEQASVVQSGAHIVGQGINAIAQANINKKTREWNEKMYQMQRQHAMQDWTMQNEYNSPEAMMQRFQKAGLNPNLIYGKGAVTEAGPIRSTDVKQWSPKAIETDLGATAGGAINTYFDVQVKKQNLDNLKAQNNLINQQSLLAAANVLNRTADTKTREFDLGMKNSLKQVSQDFAQRSLDKLTQDIDLGLQRNEREIIQNNINARTGEANMRKIAQDIISSRIQNSKTKEETESLKEARNTILKDNELKQIEINLRNKGINPNDKLWERSLQQYLDKLLNPKIGKPYSLNPLSQYFLGNQ
jgi:hypothetical protein